MLTKTLLILGFVYQTTHVYSDSTGALVGRGLWQSSRADTTVSLLNDIYDHDRFLKKMMIGPSGTRFFATATLKDMYRESPHQELVRLSSLYAARLRRTSKVIEGTDLLLLYLMNYAHELSSKKDD
jgi:hypothetical protein